MHFTNWKTAMIVHSVPEKGWALAETSGRETIFIRFARAVALVLRGMELSLRDPDGSATTPPMGAEIIFDDLIPAERGGTHPQAAVWMPKWHLDEMEAELAEAKAAHEKQLASAAKAAATLARLAQEEAARQAKRRADMAHIAANHKGKSGGGCKKKQRQHAHA